MSPGLLVRLFLLGGVLLLQTGCTAWKVNQLASGLPQAGPEATLQRLQSIQPSSRDRAQYLLNSGTLKFYTGDFIGSKADLAQAKSIMDSLQALSVTENLAAVTTNETLRSYSGTPSDRVLVHLMMALCYLFTGDAEGARVEVLQADVTMQQVAKSSGVSGQMASARYLAGVIYELNGEFDDALISYNRAYNIMQDRGETIPPALQSALLNLSLRQGRDDEYQRYKTQFGAEGHRLESGQIEWLMIYFDGVVSNKTEARLSVYSGEVNALVTVVVPRYQNAYYQPRFLSFSAAGEQVRTGILENVDKRAREDLQQQQASIMAAATLRAVAKYQMVSKAQENGDSSAVLMNLFTVLSEQADVRSWNMLPASIQIARLRVPDDAPVQVVERGVTLPSANTLQARRLAVVFTTSLSDDLYTYPVLPETQETP